MRPLKDHELTSKQKSYKKLIHLLSNYGQSLYLFRTISKEINNAQTSSWGELHGTIFAYVMILHIQ